MMILFGFVIDNVLIKVELFVFGICIVKVGLKMCVSGIIDWIVGVMKLLDRK